MTKAIDEKKIQTIANRLSEMKIPVTYGSIAGTDGRTIELPGNLKYEELTGLASHEAFHIRAKSFVPLINLAHEGISKKFKISQGIARNIVNITEDYRVNAWIKLSYKGFHEDLKNFETKFIRDNQFKAEELPLLSQMGIYFIMHDEMKDEIAQHDKFTIPKEHLESMDKIVEGFETNLSSDYGFVAAYELAKIYVKIRDAEIKQEQQQGQNGESGSKQNNQGNQNNQSQSSENQKSKSQDGQKQQNKSQDSQKQQNKSQDGQKQQNGKQQQQQSQSGQQQSQSGQQQSGQQQSGQQQSQSGQNGQSSIPDDLEKLLSDPNAQPELTPEEQFDKKNEANRKHEHSRAESGLSTVKGDENKEQFKQLQKVLEKLQSGRDISEKELKEAAEQAEEEIRKIVEVDLNAIKNKKEEFKDKKTGAICERISDKTQLIKNAKWRTKSVNTILARNKTLIAKVRQTLAIKSERSQMTRGHRSGRMNRDVIRAVASNYAYRNAFSKMTIKSKGKLMLLLDLSGSMDGSRVEMLKEATVIIAKALEASTDLRIIGYAGNYSYAYTFVFKEFGETLDMEKLDVIATRNEAGGTPTGIAIKTEVSFMRKKIPDLRNKVPMIVITDGAPNNQTYARDVCKQMKKYIKLYGIGISCYEKDMKDMFGENYIAINNASELSRKLIQLSKRIVRNS